MEERGVVEKEIGEEGGKQVWGRIEWEEKRRQKEEREKSIRESRYNRWYKEVVEEEIQNI